MTPAAEVDSRKHQFLAAGSDEFLNPAKHHRMGQTPGRTTRLRDHAKRAAIAATFLNFQVGTSLHARRELCFLEKRVSEAVVSPDGSSLRRARSEERGNGDNSGREG